MFQAKRVLLREGRSSCGRKRVSYEDRVNCVFVVLLRRAAHRLACVVRVLAGPQC